MGTPGACAALTTYGVSLALMLTTYSGFSPPVCGVCTAVHTHMATRARVRARSRDDVSTEVTHHTRAALGCVCKKTTVPFSSVASRVNPYHRSLSVAHSTSPPPTHTDAHRHTPTHNRSKHTRHNQNLYNHNDKPSHRILTWPGCLSDHQGIASRRAHRSLHFERLSRARRRHAHAVVDGTIYARVS